MERAGSAFDRICDQVVGVLRSVTHSSIVIQKISVGHYMATIDPIGTRPTFEQLEEAVVGINMASASIKIDCEELMTKYNSLKKTIEASEVPGARDRRRKQNIRRKY